MAAKSLLLAALLLVAAVGLGPHGAEADKVTIGIVSGIVPCSAGSSINVAEVPAFPNAAVQLVCGGKVVAGAKADSSGAFTINIGAVTSSLLSPLLGNQCKVAVVTPLAACNVSLASVTGKLTAPVQLLGLGGDSGSSGNGGLGGLGGLIGLITQIIGGLLGGILNIVPTAFSLV